MTCMCFQKHQVADLDTDHLHRYTGSLTVELNNGGFSIEIPNELLIVPPANITSDGSIFTDTSAVEVLIDPISGVNEHDTTILGRPFFSSSYLNVDFDAGTFTLWKAHPTGQTNLVALGGDCGNSAVANNITANKPASSGSSSPKNTQSGNLQASASKTPQLSTGAIAGVAIGSALGAAALAAAVVLCYLRRRRHRETAGLHTGSGSLAPQSQVPTPEYQGDSRTNELDAWAAQEMRAEQDPRELGGLEKPAELHAPESIREKYKRFFAINSSPVELG